MKIRFRKSDNGNQYFIEEFILNEWKILKIFYSEEKVINYIIKNSKGLKV